MSADTWTRDDAGHAVVVQCGAEAHDGAGWYYYDAEYPDEGSVGAFATEAEGRAHAASCYGTEVFA